MTRPPNDGKEREAELLRGLSEIGPGIKQLAEAVKQFPDQFAERVQAVENSFQVGRAEGRVEGFLVGFLVAVLVSVLISWLRRPVR
jgi:hypothetical protein